MRTVDARGLSCPEESMYQILVDNPTAKENVTRFATHQGYKVSYKEEGEDYILTLKK